MAAYSLPSSARKTAGRAALAQDEVRHGLAVRPVGGVQPGLPHQRDHFNRLDAHSTFGQVSNHSPQVVHVAGQSIHRVNDHGVSLADEPQHLRES